MERNRLNGFKRSMIFIVAAAMHCTVTVFPLSSLAQNGSLDLSFDTDGIVTTDVADSDDSGHSVAIQSDGKILVAGYSRISSNYEIALVRYNTNGSLDASFDIDGKVTTSIGLDSYGTSLAIQSDGKILVAGYSHNGTNTEAALVRYNTDGSLDNTFDTDGKTTTAFEDYNVYVISLAIQSDGKILVAGHSKIDSNYKIALIRYNTDGSLDNTFDTDGKVTTAVGAFHDYGRSVAIQSDGKILVAGYSYKGTNVNYDIALVRYNTNGSIDSTFDADGIITTSIGPSNNKGFSAAIQSDSKILVAGYSEIDSNYEFALVRYNTDGSLDSTFNTDGKVTTSIELDSYGTSVVIQSDGKILVAGYSFNGNNTTIALVCYNSDGSLDATFDTDGKVTTLIGTSHDYGQSVLIQSDGKILVAGFSQNGSDKDFAVLRYNNSITSGIIMTEDHAAEMKIYPNPFSTHTIFQSHAILNDARISVCNIYGQEVRQINNLSGQTITFYRHDLTSGVYFIRLAEDNKIIATNKFIIAD